MTSGSGTHDLLQHMNHPSSSNSSSHHNPGGGIGGVTTRHLPFSSHQRSNSYSSDPHSISSLDSGDLLTRWKSLSINALRKIHLNVQSTTIDLREDALDHGQGLMMSVLKLMISHKSHISVSDVQRIVSESFPSRLGQTCVIKGSTMVTHLFPPNEKKKFNPKKVVQDSPLLFNFNEFHSLLKEVMCIKNPDHQMTVFLLGILQYVAEEILKLAGVYVNSMHQKFICKEDIVVAINADQELKALLSQDSDSDSNHNSLLPPTGGTLINHLNLEDSAYDTSSIISDGHLLHRHRDSDGHGHQVASSDIPVTYQSVVKDLIQGEKDFISNVRLVTKVFRDTFLKLTDDPTGGSGNNSLPSSPTSLVSPTSTICPSGQWSVPSSPTHKSCRLTQEDMDIIFSNILDIEENSVRLLDSLEDALEAMNSNTDPRDLTGDGVTDLSPKSLMDSIGSCFEEMAETNEFDVFITFAEGVCPTISPESKQLIPSKSQQRLTTLLSEQWVIHSLSSGGHGFLSSVKYVLPKLLTAIVFHCFGYFHFIHLLRTLSRSEDDRESLNQAELMMEPMKTQLSTITKGLKVEGTFLQSTDRSSASSAIDPLTKLFQSAFLNSRNPSSQVNARELLSCIEGADLNLPNDRFIHGSTLVKLTKGRTERHAFLFEGSLLFCKPKKPPTLTITSNKDHLQEYGYRLKERYLVKEIEVIDHPDTVGDDSTDQGPSLSTSLSIYGNMSSSGLSHLKTLSPWTQSTTSLASTVVASSLGNSFSLGTSNSIAGSITGVLMNPTGTISSTFTPTTNLKLINAFEVRKKNFTNESNIIVSCATPEDKVTWMSHLTFLTTKSLLDTRLKRALVEENNRNPLQIPDMKKYRFAQPDSDANILFEEVKPPSSVVPLIRAATLIKLIERLTYHQHADPSFVRIFLTTYRSFCTPDDLFVLLKERFDIPDIESRSREDIKRFEKDYVQPIQFRVLNVIRHWVDKHYYDFDRDPVLLDKLTIFLRESIGSKKNMKKWVDSILKSIGKKQDFNNLRSCHKTPTPEVFTFGNEPPPIEWHLTRKIEQFHLLTLHPIEFARQLTLLEHELFRRVAPSELVGCAWTKKDKELKSPNLLKMIHFSTGFTYWLEKQIVEAENLEERVAIKNRILEIMMVLRQLNNFNGLLEIVSALDSAPVHRLNHTKNRIPAHLKKALEEANELNCKHQQKYQEQLRSINPPCVPFLGIYLTNIVHIEEGNPDFITYDLDKDGNQIAGATGGDPSKGSEGMTPVSLINLSKRRRVAEITGEIQQYQDAPYCLTVQSDIRNFLLNLNPIKDFEDTIRPKMDHPNPEGMDMLSMNFMEEATSSLNLSSVAPSPSGDPSSPTSSTVISPSTDPQPLKKQDIEKLFQDYLYNKSREIEPRLEVERLMVKFPRKWPDTSLKSPGIKPTMVSAATLSRKGAFGGFNKGKDGPSSAVIPSNLDSTSPNHIPRSVRGGSGPSTPITPTLPMSANSLCGDDHSVFAQVIIGKGTLQPPLTPSQITPTPFPFTFPHNNNFSPTSAFDPLASWSGVHQPPSHVLPSNQVIPPPLPPRSLRPGYNRHSASSSSPSDIREDAPPPLPPRGMGPGSSPGSGIHQRPPSSIGNVPHHQPPPPPLDSSPFLRGEPRSGSFTSGSNKTIGSAGLHQRQASHGSSPSSHTSPFTLSQPPASRPLPLPSTSGFNPLSGSRRNSDIPLCPPPASRRHSSQVTSPTTTPAMVNGPHPPVPTLPPPPIPSMSVPNHLPPPPPTPLSPIGEPEPLTPSFPIPSSTPTMTSPSSSLPQLPPRTYRSPSVHQTRKD